MIKSMTGYGRAECGFGERKLTVEIKSLNHRNTEIIVRLPLFMSSLEIDAKRKIAEKISRGRVEVAIRVDAEMNGSGPEALAVNMPLLWKYYDILERVRSEMGLSGEITLDMLTGLKGGIFSSEAEIDVSSVREPLGKALDESMTALQEMRAKEGEQLYRDFVMRLGFIKSCMEIVRSRAPEVPVYYQKKFVDRVRELSGGIDLDEARLALEVAIMAEKSDITEELVRIDSHVAQLEELLENDGAVGRKMDFILQELHREVNTVGYKCGDLAIAQNVIEIKSELAKLREQAQNIE